MVALPRPQTAPVVDRNLQYLSKDGILVLASTGYSDMRKGLILKSWRRIFHVDVKTFGNSGLENALHNSLKSKHAVSHLDLETTRFAFEIKLKEIAKLPNVSDQVRLIINATILEPILFKESASQEANLITEDGVRINACLVTRSPFAPYLHRRHRIEIARMLSPLDEVLVTKLRSQDVTLLEGAGVFLVDVGTDTEVSGKVESFQRVIGSINVRSLLLSKREQLLTDLVSTEEKLCLKYEEVIMRKEDVRKTRNQRYTKYGLDVAERVLQNSLSELEMLERLATRERTNSAEQILWLNRYLHIDEPNPFATLKDDGRDYWTKVEALSFLTSVKDSYGGRIDDILAQSRKNLVNPQRVFPEDRLEGKSFGFDSEYSLEGYRVIRTKILSLAMRAEAYDESVGGYQFIGAYVTLSGDRVLAIALNRKAVPFCYVMMELICARLQAMSVHAKGIENPD